MLHHRRESLSKRYFRIHDLVNLKKFSMDLVKGLVHRLAQSIPKFHFYPDRLPLQTI